MKPIASTPGEERRDRHRPEPERRRPPVHQPLPAEVDEQDQHEVRHARAPAWCRRAPAAARHRPAAEPPGGAERPERGGERQRQQRQRDGDERPLREQRRVADRGSPSAARAGAPRSAAVDVEVEVLVGDRRRRCRSRGSPRSPPRSGRAARCPPCAPRPPTPVAVDRRVEVVAADEGEALARRRLRGSPPSADHVRHHRVDPARPAGRAASRPGCRRAGARCRGTSPPCRPGGSCRAARRPPCRPCPRACRSARRRPRPTKRFGTW